MGFVNDSIWNWWFSFDPFACVGQPTPGWAQWLLDNKIYACMMTFFLFNGNYPSSKQLTWNNLLLSFSCWDSAYQHRSLWDYVEWHAGKSSKASFTIWLSPQYLLHNMTSPPSQVWSKIEAGRIPQPGELFQIIENQMNMKVTQQLFAHREIWNHEILLWNLWFLDGLKGIHKL